MDCRNCDVKDLNIIHNYSYQFEEEDPIESISCYICPRCECLIRVDDEDYVISWEWKVGNIKDSTDNIGGWYMGKNVKHEELLINEEV